MEKTITYSQELIAAREARYRQYNRALKGIFAVLNVFLGVVNLYWGRPYFYCLAFGGLLFFPVMTVFYRVTGVCRIEQMDFIVFLFTLFAYTVGLILRFYANVPYYDKLMHMLSGTFVGYLAIPFFYLLKPGHRIERHDLALISVFITAVSLAVAGIWEMGEYIISLITPLDPQMTAATGINDTMQDMLVCAAGTLALLWPLRRQFQGGKGGVLLDPAALLTQRLNDRRVKSGA